MYSVSLTSIKKIERTLNVTMILRDGTLKIIGDANVSKAKDICAGPGKALHTGNNIEEQNINYALGACNGKFRYRLHGGDR